MSHTPERPSIEQRVTEAMKRIGLEIQQSYDPATGFHGYPHNHGRISIAEVLRRAGRVDKNTLKETRYTDLKKRVDNFVAKQGAKLAAHHRSEERAKARAALSNSAIVESYAQQFKAAEHRAAVAEEKTAVAEEHATELELECERLRGGLAEAHSEIAELRSQLSSGKVVNLMSR